MAKQFDEESLELSARLLELNAEVYTVWNYRRGPKLPGHCCAGGYCSLWRQSLFVQGGSRTWTPIDKFINQGIGCSQRMHLTPSHNAHVTCEPACMFERPRLNVAMHLWHLACAFL